MSKIGVLLVNLGTPASFQVKDVEAYLREFLMDPRVIDIPYLLRWFLVNTVIIPKRKKMSAHSYETIWTQKGSPLYVHTYELRDALAKYLGLDFEVDFCMRYGDNSIDKALERFKSIFITTLIVVPLFPQYASATTGSILDLLYRHLRTISFIPDIRIIHHFYDEPGFIDSQVSLINTHLTHSSYDAIVLSFHGLPLRQLKKGNPTICTQGACCKFLTPQNRLCYSAQCHQTADLIMKRLPIPREHIYLGFQSKLGKDPWLEPSTFELVCSLAKKGKKKILVACPSFVADCIETIHEIGVELNEEFVKEGGQTLTVSPCLNSSKEWVEALGKMIRNKVIDIPLKPSLPSNLTDILLKQKPHLHHQEFKFF